MTDDRLGRALRSVGDRYVRDNPADFEAFKQGVKRRSRRRNWVFGLSATAATATVLVAVLFVVDAERPTTEVAGPDRLTVSTEVTLDGPASEVAGIGTSAIVALRDSNTVVRLDEGRDVPVWETRFEAAPHDVLEGASSVWVSLPDADQLARIDPTSGNAQLYDMAPFTGPTRMHVGDRALRVVVDQGVVRMSYATREPISIFEGEVHDVAMGGNAFWLLMDDGTVEGVDPDTGDDAGLLDLTLGLDGEITYLRGKLWFGAPYGSLLHRVDEATGSIEGTTELPGNYVDIDAGNDGLWVLTSDGEGGTVSSVDPVSGQLGEHSLDLDSTPLDLSHDEAGIWVSLADGRVIHLAVP